MGYKLRLGSASFPLVLLAIFAACGPNVFLASPVRSQELQIPFTDDWETAFSASQPISDARILVEDRLPAEPESSPTKITLTPYGSLWVSGMFASKRTFPSSFTLWVLSPEEQGESAFELDARRSRVGLRIEGLPLNLAGQEFETAGRVEVDFFGQFLTENAAGTRLRHAYWEAGNDEWRLLVGQTWDLISPRAPHTVNFSVAWAAGNIGFRRAQIRLERTLPIFSQSQFQLQTSINQDIVADFTSESGIRREASSIPVFMVRTGLLGPSSDVDSQFALGLSGHFGETGFDFLETSPPPLNLPPEDDARFKTWSANLDFQLPVSSRLVFQGELFHGSNLSPYLGGIGQGVCPCQRSAIHSSGGWGELAVHWSPAQTMHVGAGVDDPANGDFRVGRGLNQVIYANQIIQLSQALSTGIEFSWWRTTYQETRQGLLSPELLGPTSTGQSYVGEWMMRYDF